jgi:hypothetical protein
MQCNVLSVCLASAFFAAPCLAQDAVEPFNGKDLSGWELKEPKDRSHWKVGVAKVDPQKDNEIVLTETPEGEKGELVNVQGRGVDIYTTEKFGDAVIEVEVLVPRRSNSGIYVMGEYEVQVFDSFGRERLGQSDIGALYSAAAPKVNAIKKPGEWNKFVIEYRAPRFDENGNKTANATFVKVTLNGQTLHENVEMKGPTPTGVTGKESPTGPIMFQGDHGPVAYRNLRVTPKNSAQE